VCDALYCAIATDTGWFRFPSTTSGTLRTIAQLIELGSSPAQLYQQLYEQASPARVRLLSRVLGRISQECGGKLAHTFVKWEDYAETGAEPSETEDMVNYCLTIAGVEAAFIQIEQSNGMIKTSFRSRVHMNVASVAEQFGGGGHKQAAGAILPGPMAEARQKVLTAMRKLFE
jgi:phosphoesterase RecJ-like protein